MREYGFSLTGTLPYFRIFCAATVENPNIQCKVREKDLRERLNSKTITSWDVMMKVFGNQILKEKLDLLDVKEILILCLVKDICQPLNGQDILISGQ